MNALCALWLSLNIKPKDDARRLAPISTVGVCVKQANVSCKMAHIISADAQRAGRRVVKARGHWVLPISAYPMLPYSKRRTRTERNKRYEYFGTMTFHYWYGRSYKIIVTSREKSVKSGIWVN